MVRNSHTQMNENKNDGAKREGWGGLILIMVRLQNNESHVQSVAEWGAESEDGIAGG